MKAVDFDYVRVASVKEACRLLADRGEEAKLIAGGQTLVPLLAMRLARPSLLIDISGIAELKGMVLEDGQLEIGACTRQAEALRDASLRREVPLLAKALAFVGHGQTRNRGTVGGSLANADPAAEIGLAAVTLDAEMAARSSVGERRIAAEQFFTGPMTTALVLGECLAAVRFPRRPRAGGYGTGFKEMSTRRSDFALVAVAAEVLLDREGTCARAAIGVGGVGGKPQKAAAAATRLLGTRVAPDDVAAAARLLADAIEPQTDLYASADYRRRLAGAMAERALAEARDEAIGEGA